MLNPRVRVLGSTAQFHAEMSTETSYATSEMFIGDVNVHGDVLCDISA
jgi:hypothetical protein